MPEIEVKPEKKPEEKPPYRIEGDRAIVDIIYNGKPGQVIIRRMSVQEQGYLMKEAIGKVKVGSNSAFELDIGAFVLNVLPSVIEAAPFPITCRNDVLNARWGVGTTFLLVNAIMDLEGFNEKKAVSPSTTSSS